MNSIPTPGRWLLWCQPNSSESSAVMPFKMDSHNHIFSGLVIKCKPDEFAIFNPPSGQTCAQWAQDFVEVFGGYIDNLNDTVACRYCQFSVGNEFFEPLNIKYSNRWRDAFILFSFFGESPFSFTPGDYKLNRIVQSLTSSSLFLHRDSSDTPSGEQIHLPLTRTSSLHSVSSILLVHIHRTPNTIDVFLNIICIDCSQH